MNVTLKNTLNTNILVASVVASMFATSYARAQEVEQNDEQKSAEAGKDMEEIEVYGTALQTRRSIDKKRSNKQFSDIVGIDALGKLPDANVAEAASRLPGLSLVRDQQTGEGSLLSIRGLDSTLNTYSVNGVRMGTANPDSRAVSLQVLPPDGVKMIEVRKSLTPDMDGDALGGAVNIELPNAFDFDGFHASLSADVNYHERSEKLGKTFSGAISNTFGKNVGVYVGAYYGQKDSVAEETENEGDWMPYRWIAGGDEYVDPRSYMMQGLGLDLFENELERWGVNTSIDFKYGDNSSFHIRGQYNKYQDVEVHNWLDVRNQSSDRLVQVNVDDTSLGDPAVNIIGHDASLGSIYGYSVNQIVDTDGDGIITDADKAKGGLYTLHGRSGTWDPEGIRLWRGVEYQVDEQVQATITIGGVHNFDNLSVDYDLSYAKAKNDRPYEEGVEFGFRQSEPWLENRGVHFSFPDPRYPQWQLNQAGLEGLFDFTNFPFDDAWAEHRISKDEKKIGQINFTYDVNSGALNTIKFGGKVTLSERSFDESDVANLSINDSLTMADVGSLIAGEYPTFFDGEYSGFQSFGSILDGKKVSDAIRSCDAAYFENASSGCVYNDQAFNGTEFIGLKEDEYAAYAMANMSFGAEKEWEVIAGLRFERTELESNSYRESSFPDKDDEVALAKETHGYNNFLPSVHVIYRPSENIIWRGAVWSSFVRPEFDYIAGGSSYSYDLVDGEVTLTGISRRNIALKPQKAWNFDFGFEYYLGKDGLISANLYYKDISDFLVVDKRNTESFSSDGVSISEPKNLNSAFVKGIELGYTHTFSFLPEPFNGLGVIANVTFQDSEGDPVDDWRTDTPPFVNAPDELYNFALYYEKNGWEGRLSYQHTGLYLEDPRSNGVDKYIQPTSFLDFNLSYYWSQHNIRFTFQAKNLLEEHLYWATRGQVNGYQKDYVEAGRTFNFGISWKY